jgi:hypothetical protein
MKEEKTEQLSRSHGGKVLHMEGNAFPPVVKQCYHFHVSLGISHAPTTLSTSHFVQEKKKHCHLLISQSQRTSARHLHLTCLLKCRQEGGTSAPPPALAEDGVRGLCRELLHGSLVEATTENSRPC